MSRSSPRRKPPVPARAAGGSGRAAAEGHYQRGLAASRQAQWAEAAAAFEQACRLAPRDAVFWVNLAQAYRKLGRHDECAACARKALVLDPGMSAATQLLADGLKAQHRYEDAVSALREVAQHSNTTQARYELAHALIQAGKPQEAIQELMAALVITPHYIPGHLQLGNVFKSLKLHHEASQCFVTAFTLNPQDASALAAAMYESLYACEWDRYEQHVRTLSTLVQQHVTSLPVPFMFLAMSDSRADQLRVSSNFAHNQTQGVPPLPPLPPYRPRRDTRPRVAYFSNDLRHHPVAVNIIEVLELHDRQAIDLTIYSYGPDDHSTWRKRTEAAGGARFVEARHMANRALAERIRADGIELLIDLTGFTKDSRSSLLAARPAPVQASYLGFPGTQGAGFFDYLICDARIAPLEHADGYREKLAHLPGTYQPNDRQRTLLPAPARSECGLPAEGFVFCCMNNNYKITPAIFDIWCRLLRQVPHSVLWLFDANAQARQNLLNHAAARGVEPHRIVFAPPTSGDKHLARMRLADLFLDTLPYNAHTTGGDVLWSGVPMITCPGETFASRVAASLLHGAGLPELVAGSLDEYEAMALRLATHPDELSSLRARLWANRQSCALFDSRQATRNLEHLYIRMVERWRQGLPAEHLAGEPARPPAERSSAAAGQPLSPASAEVA